MNENIREWTSSLIDIIQRAIYVVARDMNKYHNKANKQKMWDFNTPIVLSSFEEVNEFNITLTKTIQSSLFQSFDHDKCVCNVRTHSNDVDMTFEANINVTDGHLSSITSTYQTIAGYYLSGKIVPKKSSK